MKEAGNFSEKIKKGKIKKAFYQPICSNIKRCNLILKTQFNMLIKRLKEQRKS